ncbi:MAG: EamA family transporter RarD [Lachnospiraceae bacterium]
MKKGILSILTCYILWGLLPIFWKLLASVNSTYVLASRMTWSLIFCMIIILFKRRFHIVRDLMQDKKTCLYLLLCGVLVSTNWGLYIYTVNSGHIIEGSFAYYIYPIFSILIGTIFYKERLTLLQWFSVIIATTGVLISIVGYGTVPFLSLMLALTFAVYGALKKKVTISSEISVYMETFFLVPFSLVFIIFSEIHHSGSIGILTGGQFLLLPLSGLVTTIPLLLFAKGIRETPLSLSGILMYLNPTLQLLVGVFVFHETFTKLNGITFGFIWVAIALFIADSILTQKKSISQ